MTNLSTYEAAGLYDPADADHERARELLFRLEDFGLSPAEIVSAAKTLTLSDLADSVDWGPVPELTFEQAASQIGISVEELDRVRRNAVLAPRPFDRPAFTVAEVAALAGLQSGGEMFTVEESNHFARVLGSSLGRIADAAVSLFLIDVEGPLLNAGGSSVDVVKENFRASGALDVMAATMDPLLRMHLQDAIRRSRESRHPEDDAHISRMAIGFVDLVGFTAFSENVPVAELGLLVRRFEDAAYDLVADNGGRVVKLIGDEVMFVSVEPQAAIAIAMSLVEEFREDHVTPRGGLAYGKLLARGGDYYGRIVNLASRIGDMAVPCELLATQRFSERCPDYDFEPAGRRQVKGLDAPVSLVSISC